MPYSDNLYSIDSDDEYPDLEPMADHGVYQTPFPQPVAPSDRMQQGDIEVANLAALPAGGIFPSSDTNVTNTRTSGASSHIAHVPNVLVCDPSLDQGSTAESKAREAREEQQAAVASSAAAAASAGVDSDSCVANPPVLIENEQHNLGATSPHSSSAPAAHATSSPTTSRATYYYQPSIAGAYSSYAPSPSSSHNTSFHLPPRRSINTASSPFIPREAPPAYTPSPTLSSHTCSTSPTSPTTSSQPDFSRNYQTFSQPGMGRLEETRGLLAPESMGGPPDDEFGDATPAWRERIRQSVSHLSWRNCRYAIVCLVLGIVTVGFLVSRRTSVSDDLKHKDPSSSQPPNSPVKEPPHMDYPPYDGDLPWPSDSTCSYKPLSKVEFNLPVLYGSGRSFSLVQDVAEPDGQYGTHDVHVIGDVVVRHTSTSSGQEGTKDPSVSIDIAKNDESFRVSVDYDKDTQSLHVTTPRRLRDMDSTSRPCVSIRITLWVPGDASLDSLSIDTVHLGIRLMDNLALTVQGESKLSTVVGPIVASTDGTDRADNLVEEGAPDYFKFDSRYIEVRSVSAPITGYWPLYDYLGLFNTAGKIKVRVSPKEEKEDAPKPATLYVKTLSGGIEVWEPVEKAQSSLFSVLSTNLASSSAASAEKLIPPRDYRVNIQSTSANIKAAVVFSSSARVHSTSGGTMVELLPVLDLAIASSTAASNLETSTTSGTTKFQVLEPLWYAKGKGYLPHLPALPPRDSRPIEPVGDVVTPIGRIGNGDPYRSFPPAVLPPSLSPLPTRSSPPSSELASDAQLRSRPDDSSAPPLRCLASRHASTSATMYVIYPASWEGELNLGSLSGSLKVGGDGVRIIRAGKDWPGVSNHLIARKGDDHAEGESVATLKSTSGKIVAVVGEGK